MTLRNARPFTFRPSGCTDSVDGSNAPRGSMVQLANLVPAPHSAGVFVCRPAAFQIINFAGLGFAGAGFVSSCLVIGDIAYGTVATTRNAGKDEPYAVNLITGLALTVNGVTNANTPTQPPSSGAWTPPIVAQVGSRIIVTHPGFSGGATKFGWFDISGFSETALINSTTGSPTLTGNPSILGVEPGMTVTGAGMAAGATVVSTANYVNATTANVASATTLNTIGNITGLAIGQAVGGSGIPVGTTISNITGSGVSTTVTTSNPMTGSGAINVTFSGATLTLSANATATNTQSSVTIAGGTSVAPLWGAGDTDRNNLPSVPVGVAQFNGRAYYALGLNGVVFSDSGFPCRVSNNPFVQALTTNDGLPVTAVAPLMLSVPLTGGIVQALLAFESTWKIQQITGDPTTNNLSMNALEVATGTASPLSITPCELGTAFVSPEGVRVVEFSGNVSPPIGDAGTGITTPFIYSVVPSRVCGAANSHLLRFAVQNGFLPTTPQQDWWYDIGRQIWNGPMSLIPSLIQPWAGPNNQNTFVMAPQGIPGSLWQCDPVPSLTSTYVENSQQMQWIWQPTALPDTGEVSMYALGEGETSFAGAFDGSRTQVSVTDISGQVVVTTLLPRSALAANTVWGTSVWGTGFWGAGTTSFQQWPIYFPSPVVFRQLSPTITGPSAAAVMLGNFYMSLMKLGYALPIPQLVA